MKILLDYNPVDGAIAYDGIYIFNHTGLEHLEHKEPSLLPDPIRLVTEDQGTAFNNADMLINLKKSGFSVEDILELKQNDLI